jgi:glycosyltransferase involved in cell wall biosynthesis
MAIKPLVTIAMPVRNCQGTLVPAIRSVVLQTYSNWLMLLIDDGSADDTLKVARSFRDERIVILSDGKSLGLTERLNQALALSTSSLFARMDGDDVAYPERLAKQIRYLEQHPQVDLVGAGVIVFRQAGVPIGKQDAPECHDAICKKPFARFPIAHPTYLGKTEWFRHYLYNNSPQSEDQNLLLRSYRFSHFANVPEILLGYRQEKIDLGKILKARRALAHFLAFEYRRQGRLDLAFRAYTEQVLKTAADVVATRTGLNYHLLRHRALPISQTERHEWELVWKVVNQFET